MSKTAKGDSFAGRLNALKRERAISGVEIAKGIGVTEAAVSKWTTRGTIPDGENLAKLAAFFGIDSQELVFGRRATAAVARHAIGLVAPEPSLKGDWAAAGLGAEIDRIVTRFQSETGRTVASLSIENGQVRVTLSG
jgi:transcriptional regulator with XRE-family HTH domain